MDISRNPKQYDLSVHALNKAKQRDIPFETVSEAIRSGDIEPSPRDNCKVFVHDSHITNLPIGVVVNVVDKDIITIEWEGRSVD